MPFLLLDSNDTLPPGQFMSIPSEMHDKNSVMHVLHCSLISCSKSTDAWKRLLTNQAPPSFCIEIVRFQNDGQQLGNLIDYKETVLFS